MKKYWEIIADHLSADGWSWGMTTAIDPDAGRIFIVDAHRANSGERFIIHSNEPLTAFLELEEQLRRAAVPHGD
ncbi:MAG: hypothetical protein H0X40_19585 [Chthoniobacterales bacterium]|nr:hypothetical protein [Chthoniobacterales bacterium]